MLILIGLRGSGKTTVGRLIAERRGVGFIDLDDVTAGIGGVRHAADLLRSRGEEYFRECEEKALRQVCGDGANADAVLALGGGTPTYRGSLDTLRRLKREGVRKAGTDPARSTVTIVYLRAKAATLAANLSATDLSTRPSLTGKGVLEEIDPLLERRDPLYRGLADTVIELDADGQTLTAQQVAERLSALK